MWLQQVHSVLKKHGMGNIWDDPLRYNPYTTGRHTEQRLNDIYIQTWRRTQSQSSRYKLQSQLQDEYKISPYLLNINNIECRNNLSRLRIDMNTLNECLGRQKRSTTRCCPHCKPTIESVQHFILECPVYENERLQLFNSLEPHLGNLGYISTEFKLKYILNAYEPTSSKIIAIFLNNIYKKRRDLILSVTQPAHWARYISCANIIVLYIIN